MLNLETSKALLRYINDPEFCKVWKTYMQDFIKQKELEIRRYTHGNMEIFSTIAQIKLLEEFERMPERVREKTK